MQTNSYTTHYWYIYKMGKFGVMISFYMRKWKYFKYKDYKSQYLYFLSSLFHAQKWMFCWIPIVFLLCHVSLRATQAHFTSVVIKNGKAPPKQSLLIIKLCIFASVFTDEWVSTSGKIYSHDRTSEDKQKGSICFKVLIRDK